MSKRNPKCTTGKLGISILGEPISYTYSEEKTASKNKNKKDDDTKMLVYIPDRQEVEREHAHTEFNIEFSITNIFFSVILGRKYLKRKY